jgi:DNA-directed RNA polymerase subunit beta'
VLDARRVEAEAAAALAAPAPAERSEADIVFGKRDA